jgi:hypothetical protein
LFFSIMASEFNFDSSIAARFCFGSPVDKYKLQCSRKASLPISPKMVEPIWDQTVAKTVQDL